MKDYAPVYYDRFHCIADKCRHSCCKGWEVDIDKQSLERYMSLKSKTGEKIRENISGEDGAFFFRMTEEGNCPFLCENGLCEIIINEGEECLCDICREHPRFYNFFTQRTEWGLGLTCEEAARIIIKDKESFSLTLKCDDGVTEAFEIPEDEESEEYVLFIRDESIKILEENEGTTEDRIKRVLDFCGCEKCETENAALFELFSSFERLEESWSETLSLIKKTEKCGILNDKRYARAFENLAKYFLYRHIPGAVYDERLPHRAYLMYSAVKVIALICQVKLNEIGSLNENDIADISRAFSSEIEYSDENTDKIFDYYEMYFGNVVDTRLKEE